MNNSALGRLLLESMLDCEITVDWIFKFKFLNSMANFLHFPPSDNEVWSNYWRIKIPNISLVDMWLFKALNWPFYSKLGDKFLKCRTKFAT